MHNVCQNRFDLDSTINRVEKITNKFTEREGPGTNIVALIAIVALKVFSFRKLKQEEVVKKTQWSTGKFPFKWNRGWLNFNTLAAASS